MQCACACSHAVLAFNLVLLVDSLHTLAGICFLCALEMQMCKSGFTSLMHAFDYDIM